MAYADRIHKVLVGRTGDWLDRTSLPRVTMLLAFIVGVASAWWFSSRLVQVGLSGMGPRFAICCLAGYLTFVLFLGTWCLSKSAVEKATLLQGAAAKIKTREPGENEDLERQIEEMQDQIQESMWQADDRGGAVVLLMACGILGLAFVAFHWIGNARWYLGTILVQAGKVSHRTVGASGSGAWLIAPLAQTVGWAVVLAIHYGMIGLALQVLFPHASTVADVMRQVR